MWIVSVVSSILVCIINGAMMFYFLRKELEREVFQQWWNDNWTKLSPLMIFVVLDLDNCQILFSRIFNLRITSGPISARTSAKILAWSTVGVVIANVPQLLGMFRCFEDSSTYFFHMTMFHSVNTSLMVDFDDATPFQILCLIISIVNLLFSLCKSAAACLTYGDFDFNFKCV